MSPSGSPEPSTWASLLAAETLGHGDPQPYTFVTVSESIPETLEVHRGSHVVLSTPANTGVAGATTEQGTFPIYARYTSTTMTGTNPDGSKYSDPGVPWVNYFNGGDAVHGFPRASYGTPQSNGCVELPIGTAASRLPAARDRRSRHRQLTIGAAATALNQHDRHAHPNQQHAGQDHPAQVKTSEGQGARFGGRGGRRFGARRAWMRCSSVLCLPYSTFSSAPLRLWA